jgi:hypothetical protein
LQHAAKPMTQGVVPARRGPEQDPATSDCGLTMGVVDAVESVVPAGRQLR